MFKIESLLAARLFLAPQIAGDRLFFISNLSGRLSLYAMREGGSVPEPLVPPDIALQNPDLVGGYPYSVFPRLGKILVMLDHDGDENYQPMLIPLEGGFPAPAFGDFFAHFRVACTECDRERGIVYLSAESRLAQITQVYRGDLRTGELVRLDESTWGAAVSGASADHRQAVIVESYTVGDTVLYLLLTFMERIPETWKPYFAVAVGDPQRDRALLAERSPRSYIDRIACPLLVIQGKNDPRVIERESRDVVEQLRARGKAVEYLVFENEGHDVLKFENRVTCYNAITEFFRRHLL